MPGWTAGDRFVSVENDLRATLQYVPLFRGRTFVIVVNAAQMREQVLAEVLLDLRSLQQVGVRLLVVSVGSGEAGIANRFVEEELCWQMVDGAMEEMALRRVLERGQLALMERPGLEPLGVEVTRLCQVVEASKLITFWPEARLAGVEDVHAVSSKAARDWKGAAAELLHHAARVCHEGVPRVHLLSEVKQGVLLQEIFSNEGVGLMVHTDAYMRIHALAQENIAELLAMIGRSMRDSHLVPRTYEEVEERLEDFLVMRIDENVVGCVALHHFPEGCAEIACLYVKQTHESGGYGRLLVRAAEEKARQEGVRWVFALTNRAFEYFIQQLGYEEISPTEIPAERQAKLRESQRQSKVIRRQLS